jgi:hypothetical protein
VRAVRNVARAALVAVVAVGGLIAWVFGRALPQTSGRLTLPGLTTAVSVLRITVMTSLAEAAAKATSRRTECGAGLAVADAAARGARRPRGREGGSARSR